jgi:transketolase N-terminal domain/subunit
MKNQIAHVNRHLNEVTLLIKWAVKQSEDSEIIKSESFDSMVNAIKYSKEEIICNPLNRITKVMAVKSKSKEKGKPTMIEWSDVTYFFEVELGIL